jgi:hypothetical protein
MIDQNSAALDPQVLSPDELSTGSLNDGPAGFDGEGFDRENTDPDEVSPDEVSPEELGADELHPDVGPMHWTGRMEFDLSDAQGRRIGTVEIVIRIDHLSLWFGNRTLAVMDRDLFREWLIDPAEPFGIDDVTWSMDEVGTLLTIDDAATYAIPNPVVQHLVQVV